MFENPIEVENVNGKKKKVIPTICIMDVTGYDEPKETVENDAYSNYRNLGEASLF